MDWQYNCSPFYFDNKYFSIFFVYFFFLENYFLILCEFSIENCSISLKKKSSLTVFKTLLYHFISEYLIFPLFHSFRLGRLKLINSYFIFAESFVPFTAMLVVEKSANIHTTKCIEKFFGLKLHPLNDRNWERESWKQWDQIEKPRVPR